MEAKIRRLTFFCASSLPQGNAIGRCPKDKLFKGYIELELQVGGEAVWSAVKNQLTLFSPYLPSPHPS